MAGKVKDLVGKRFGKLRVVKRSPDPRKSAYWLAQCDCGVEKVVRGSQLTSGNTVSCGCYGRERTRKINTRHGKTNSFEFRVWTAMRKRCSYEKHPAYHRYGGRGIKVCARWNKFENFLADMGVCPFPAGSIERRDNDKNYTPSNCVWLPRKLQSVNRKCVTTARMRNYALVREISGLYELIAGLYIKLSGKTVHASDCATSNAPAQLPGPCNCNH